MIMETSVSEQFQSFPVWHRQEKKKKKFKKQVIHSVEDLRIAENLGKVI